MDCSIELPDLRATAAFAEALAPLLEPGDVLGLAGPLGAGKTAFARALIGERLAALGRREEVPSPTYTLVQVYDLGGVELWHADLYRLGDVSELEELGLEDAFGSAIALVEWPERLGARLPQRLLSLQFAFVVGAEEGRRLRLSSPSPHWAQRLAPILAATPAPTAAPMAAAAPAGACSR